MRQTAQNPQDVSGQSVEGSGQSIRRTGQSVDGARPALQSSAEESAITCVFLCAHSNTFIFVYHFDILQVIQDKAETTPVIQCTAQTPKWHESVSVTGNHFPIFARQNFHRKKGEC